MDSHDEETHPKQTASIRRQRIRELNDLLRCHNRGGSHCLTNGIVSLSPETIETIRRAVAEFVEFTDDNDPYGEHDFGALTVQGHRVFWKIDYYDLAMRYASPDPSDPTVTARYLTVMLASEY